MDFNKYVPTTKIVSATYRIYVYKNGAVAHQFESDEEFKQWKTDNNIRIIGAVPNERVCTNEEEVKASRIKYNTEENLLHQEFKNDLFEEFGVTDNPKKELLFDKAWDDGHYAGYSEVYNCFEGLVDLIR
jgi:hypothetical protein